MSFRLVPRSSTQGVDDRKLTRIRAFVVSALLAGVLLSLAPTSALAVTGNGVILGPWSCGPDQTISMATHVTGSAGSYVDLDPIRYTDFIGDPALWSIRIYPGWTTLHLPNVGRTINWFQYTTHGNAALVAWPKSCS
jgi:hypothetical protein